MGIFRDLYRAVFKRLRGFGFGFGLFNAVHRLLWEGWLQPRWVEIEGVRLYLQKRDPAVSDTLRMQEVWEPEQLAALKRLLKPGMTFLDAGANVGYYSLLAANLVGEEGRVLAFEPDLNNLEMLRKNAAANDAVRLEIHPVAVADKNGTARFHVAADNPASHSIVFAPEGETRTRTVKVVGLEEYLGEGFCPDVAKFDVEGAEFAAIKGMGKMLDDPRLKAIFFECDDALLEKAGTSGSEIRSLLAAHGFRFEQLTPRDVLARRD